MILPRISNKSKPLVFSGPHIGAHFIEGIQDYAIVGRTIVVNPCDSDVIVGESPRSVIPPFASTVLVDTRIARANAVILLELLDINNIGNLILEPGWVLYGDLLPTGSSVPEDSPVFPRNTPLWRSSQDNLCALALDPRVMTHQRSQPEQSVHYQVKANLWFAPGGTDCFIHRKHEFLELHTQIFGNGRMQKFKAQDRTTLYEDILMSPGCTTSIPFCEVEQDGHYAYPWHQYRSDNDCIWMALEYHPI